MYLAGSCLPPCGDHESRDPRILHDGFCTTRRADATCDSATERRRATPGWRIPSSSTHRYGVPRTARAGGQHSPPFLESQASRLALHRISSLEDGKLTLSNVVSPRGPPRRLDRFCTRHGAPRRRAIRHQGRQRVDLALRIPARPLRRSTRQRREAVHVPPVSRTAPRRKTRHRPDARTG